VLAGAGADPLDSGGLETGDGLSDAAVGVVLGVAAPGEQPAVTAMDATAMAHVTAARSRHRAGSQSIQ